jgi:hypothetical protein
MRCLDDMSMREVGGGYMRSSWIALVMIAAAGTANAQEKPNVVLMLADNIGYGDIGAYGAGEVRGMPTPRIDQLASEDLRLTQYLVEPACTPSRAALMTGRYSQRLGLSTVIIGGTPQHPPGRRSDARRAVQEPRLRHRHYRQVASRGKRAELANTPRL